MLKRAFKFTGKDLLKLSIMIIVATILFGLPGLMMMLLLQWLTHQSYALESVDKHGISQIGASRLGGAAIFGSSAALYFFWSYSNIIEKDLPNAPVIAWFAVLFCVIIGLIDDLRNDLLSAKTRLVSIFLLFSVCFYMVPELIPQKIGLPGLDFLLEYAVVGWLLTIVLCVGFVNAINMADGANGLIPGTITIAFIVFYLEVGLISYAIFMMSCGIFTIFNVISGRLFLGDAGAYGLGSVVALNGLYLHSEGIFSAAFLAVLFAYPCIDILVTVIRRWLSGRSIFLPDNDHLHNRVYFHCNRWIRSKTLANSVTGVLIVSFSSGMALAGFTMDCWPVSSNQWGWIFLLQCCFYTLAFFFTGLSSRTSQFVAH